jgi:adenosylhomocysteine nucleosidase
MPIKLGIIGAMEVEVDLLLGHMAVDGATQVSGTVFYEGSIAGTPVVVVRCGIGKVNAAMTTQTLIDRFGATHVINTGVAGGLDPSLEVGDIVVSADAVQHDMDVTGLGYVRGMAPEMTSLTIEGGKAFFEADERLRALAVAAAAEVAPEVTTIEGRVASGDLFVCEDADRERILKTFGAHCCEMEGAAIAQVCWRNRVPFVIVRAISDKADDSSKDNYRSAEAETGEHCARIALRTIGLLG